MAEESENGSDSPCQDPVKISALTEEQENFITECENLFANRYTEEDPDYKNIIECGIGDPLIVDPWYHKPKRNFVWSGRRDDRRNDSPRNDYRDDRRDRYRHHDGDSGRRDRYRNDRRDSYHSRDGGRFRNNYQNYRRDPRPSY